LPLFQSNVIHLGAGELRKHIQKCELGSMFKNVSKRKDAHCTITFHSCIQGFEHARVECAK
jgi:hypothetical protein